LIDDHGAWKSESDNHAMYGFWIWFSLLTGLFSFFYNVKAELLPAVYSQKINKNETAQAVGPSLLSWQYYGEASPRKAHTLANRETPKTKIAFSKFPNLSSSSPFPIPIPLRAPTNAFEIQILKP
jgi:hypothetical protein